MASVRFWAGARALAGVGETTVAGDSVAAVLDEVRGAYPELAPLLEVSVVLVDGVQALAGEDSSVGDQALVEILPPYAGG